MSTTKNLLMLISTIFLSLMVTVSAFAQSSNPEWISELEFDLLVDHECKVAEYLNMHEGKIGGRNMYFAKVKCTDGRTFEAGKVEPQDEFEIRVCEVISC